MHKVIIDTDPGVDDAQAIALALAHPEIDLLGLTTVFGNATVDITTRNALKILELLGATKTPVALGADRPLSQKRFPSPDFVHGDDALGNLHLPAPKSSPLAETAAEFMVRYANRYRGELYLIAIGPLTNIAHALQLDPALPSKVKRLIVMGGTLYEPGNVTPIAEANFICDPHAADIVLGADWPSTVVGLDVTHQTSLFDRDLQLLRDCAGRVGEFLWRSSRFYFAFYRADQNLAEDEESRVPLHDVSAVVALLEPSAFKYLHGAARVTSSGIGLGQLSLDSKGRDYLLPHWHGRPQIQVATQVDANLVRHTFVDTIKNNN